MCSKLVGLAFGALLAWRPVLGADLVLPPALIANVRDFGAKGDGVADDTAALQQAICSDLGRRIVFLPAGTYRVTHRLEGKDCSGTWAPFLRIAGQNTAKTTIRLSRGASGYGDAASPLAVLFTASADYEGANNNDHVDTGAGNEAFRNFVEDLTIDVGNNPGAVALDFVGSNIAAIRNVTLKGHGAVGLSLARPVNGPLLVKNLVIEGFAHGIDTALSEYGGTFEHVTLRNQGTVGLYNNGGALAIRDLASTNSVPAVINASPVGQVVLVDARLTGGAANISAIRNDWDVNHYDKGSLFLRNVTSAGYASALQDGDAALAGETIGEYSSNGQLSLFPSQFGSLDLPVQETPGWQDTNLADWANVADYGAIATQPDGSQYWGDDSDAIQSALNSGKSTVYFPAGTYLAYKQLVVPGTVRRIYGPFATISPWTAFRDGANPLGLFSIVGGVAPLFIEGLSVNNIITNDGQAPLPGLIGIDHLSKRPVVVRDFGCCNLSAGFHATYRGAPGAGRLFVEDASAAQWRLAPGQSAWMRQFDPEGSGLLTDNDGARLWVLGIKTEGHVEVVRTEGGGATELLGGALYSFGGYAASETPFDSVDSRMSLSYATTAFGADDWQNQVTETRGGVVRLLPRNAGEWRGDGTSIALYVAAPAVAGAPATGDGTGLLGQYFDNPDYTDLVATRIDPTVNFDWKSWFDPIDGIDKTQGYSIAWSGFLEAPWSGTYTVCSQGDDSVPLWVGGQQLVGDTFPGGCGAIALSAGQRYPVQLDFQPGGSARVSLGWQPPGATRVTVVPRTQPTRTDVTQRAAAPTPRANRRPWRRTRAPCWPRQAGAAGRRGGW